MTEEELTNLPTKLPAKVAADELKQAVEEEAEVAAAPGFEVIPRLQQPAPPRASGCGRREVHGAHSRDAVDSRWSRLAADPEEAAKNSPSARPARSFQEVLAENYTGMLIVIGADTMVVLDGEIFQARSASDGKHMLRSLSAAPTRSSRPCPSGWWPLMRARTCRWASAPSPT